MSTTVAIRLDDALAARYDELAKNTGRTKTFYMTQALEESIDTLEYIYNLRKQSEDWRAGKLETYTLDEARRLCGLDA